MKQALKIWEVLELYKQKNNIVEAPKFSSSEQRYVLSNVSVDLFSIELESIDKFD